MASYVFRHEVGSERYTELLEEIQNLTDDPNVTPNYVEE